MSTTNESADFTRLRDDILWLYAAQGCSPTDGLRVAVDAMIAEYTADSDHYSDGSRIGAEYIPDCAPNVILYEPLPPPHRRNPTGQPLRIYMRLAPVLRGTRSIRTSACFIWGERHRAGSFVGG